MKNVGFTQSEFLTQIWHSRPFRYTDSVRKICEKLSVFNILNGGETDYESGGREFESSRARHYPFWHPQKITRFGLFALSWAYKWSYIRLAARLSRWQNHWGFRPTRWRNLFPSAPFFQASRHSACTPHHSINWCALFAFWPYAQPL